MGNSRNRQDGKYEPRDFKKVKKCFKHRGSSVMEGWETVRLGDVLTERRETPQAEDLSSGRVRVVSKIAFSDGLIQLRHGSDTKTGMISVHPGDILVSGINAAKGAIAIYNIHSTEPIAATIHYGAYIPNDSRVDRTFLWWLLRSQIFRDLLQKYVPGGIKTELKAKRLLPIPITIPSLEEQRRIVARVEEMAAKIEEARELREKVTLESKALMNSTLQGFIGELNQNWVRLGSILERIENGWSPQCESRQATSDEWGVLKVGAVSFGQFNVFQNKALPVSLEPKPEYEVRSGDFLMSRANTTSLVGACALVKETRTKLMLSDKIFRFIFPPDSQIDKEFLDLVLKSPALRDQIEKGASGTSPTMKNISKEKVQNLLIPYPALTDQKRIVEIWNASQNRLRTLEKLQSSTKLELDALLPSILARAFAGEL